MSFSSSFMDLRLNRMLIKACAWVSRTRFCFIFFSKYKANIAETPLKHTKDIEKQEIGGLASNVSLAVFYKADKHNSHITLH